MTTGKKLWLGFGTLTALLVLLSAVIILRVLSIETQVGEMENARKLSAETTQLEINVLGYALGVRTYLQSGELKPRQEAANDAADVERHFGEYQRLATTSPQREIATRFANLWQEFKKLGQELLALEGSQFKPEDSQRFYDLRSDLEKLLDDEMQVDAIQAYDARKNAALDAARAVAAFVLGLLIVGSLIAKGRVLSSAEVLFRRSTRCARRMTSSKIGFGSEPESDVE